MAVIAARLRDAFPGVFDDPAHEAAIGLAIARAKRRAPEAVYGTRWDDAILYLSAHFASLLIAAEAAAATAGGSAAAGSISSISAGPVSMSFSGGSSGGSSDSGADGPWTIYLGMFEDLSKSKIVRALAPLRGP